MQTKAHFLSVMTRGKNMTLTHQISRRLALALVASASLFSSVGIAAADKIKVVFQLDDYFIFVSLLVCWF